MSPFLEQIRFRGLGAAVEAHIQELAYELLKDPEHQRWMEKWLDEGLEILLRSRARRRGGR